MISWRDGRRRDAEPGAAIERGAADGFTLIETIVVLTIIGLTLTIVIGFLPRPGVRLELDNATSFVVDAMRIARSRSITESRPVPLTVTRDGHGIQIDSKRFPLGGSVSVATPGRQAILFTPDGGASGGPLSVLVANRVRLIQVDWLSGRITIGDPS
jgi:general secretion pathway protein H